jgi:gas vesicle protein
MEENGTSVGKAIALMFVGGVVLGAVAGLLFAPKAGKDTRREIKDYTTKVSHSVSGMASRTKAGIEAALERGRALLGESRAA